MNRKDLSILARKLQRGEAVELDSMLSTLHPEKNIDTLIAITNVIGRRALCAGLLRCMRSLQEESVIETVQMAMLVSGESCINLAEYFCEADSAAVPNNKIRDFLDECKALRNAWQRPIMIQEGLLFIDHHDPIRVSSIRELRLQLESTS